MTIDNKPITLTGNTEIDDEHQTFIGIISQLGFVGNAEFPALFKQLYTHAEQHFQREEQLIKQTAFPSEIEHIGEHWRVLAEFKQFKIKADKGRVWRSVMISIQ
ncbi:hemerythrin family protein [Methylomonas sp. AM2-LC]|uniref:bacteriohemerythrin n=1 Tax=Methylomonas sp. AM2-LC TaxID=3153301 RepID=UPI0032642B2E